jgi:hypothetical protein
VRWLTFSGSCPDQPHLGWSTRDEPVRLTVFYPYGIENATDLAESWTGEVNAETLLAEPELAVMLHRLVRGYDRYVPYV